MDPNPQFPRILEEYRSYLRRDAIEHVSLNKFCKERHLDPKSATQWMRRHGITASTLEYDALFEKCGTDKQQVISALESKHRKSVEIPDQRRKLPIGEDKLMRSVGITFPDGLQVTIRETSPQALSDFIELYNQKLDMSYVRPK